MDDLSLTHTKYNCTYHIVFTIKISKESNVWTAEAGSQGDFVNSV